MQFDTDCWRALKKATSAKEITWHQCPLAADPSKANEKASVWLASDDIATTVPDNFGHLRCRHPHGTHKPLRGTNADGDYYTRTSDAENYSSEINRLVTICIGSLSLRTAQPWPR